MSQYLENIIEAAQEAMEDLESWLSCESEAGEDGRLETEEVIKKLKVAIVDAKNTYVACTECDGTGKVTEVR